MITIEGYSGCGIKVMRSTDNADYILEKSSESSAYVPRLIKQIEKQSAFASFNRIGEVLVPKVLYIRTEMHQPLPQPPSTPLLNPMAAVPLSCTVGMNFLHHTDAITFLSAAPMHHIRGFASTLMSILQQYVKVSPVSAIPVRTFTEKLLDIQRLCAKNVHICEHDKAFVCSTLIPSLTQWLESPAGSSSDGEAATASEGGPPSHDGTPQAPITSRVVWMPVGMCHGDFTLSNILVATQDNDEFDSSTSPSQLQSCCDVAPVKVILIDFLDSFVESPLADMAKLCQDLKFAWTIRVSSHLHGGTLDVIQFFSILQFLYNQLVRTFASYEWYRKYFSFMLVMNQLRVLQYAKDPHAASYLFATVMEEFKVWSASVPQNV